MSISISNRRQNSIICPIVKNPFTDCYCFNLNSRNINPTIKYCGNDFESCEIYKNSFMMQSRLSGQHDEG